VPLSHDERADLRDFVDHAADMARSPILRDSPIELQIRYERGLGLAVTNSEPPRDDLELFARRLRRVLVQDRIFIRRIHRLVERGTSDTGVRDRITALRRAWTKALNEGGIQIIVDDKRWTPEHIMNLWINAFIEHSDRDKAEMLKSLGPPGLMITRYGFVGAVFQTGVLVVITGRLVREALDRNLFQ
jgi:hypothetical protein